MPLCGDSYPDGDDQRHYIYESDFALFKPRADLILDGVCHAPDHQPVRACPITFSVGERSKTLWVFGNRYWSRNRVGLWRIGDPEPFTTMPVTYENSFGGAGYDKNPVGKGYMGNLGNARQPDEQGWALPNIEDSHALITTPHSKISPSGFGPLDRMWSPRVKLAGTLDKTWLKNDWPDLPKDFDWGYFNAAPRDMQADGYLRGDESLVFENLHADTRIYRSHLPGLRARCFVSPPSEGARQFAEVTMNLDTLWVEMEKERLVLVWRGVAPVASAEAEEIDKLLVVSEALSSTPRDGEYYWARYQADQTAAEPIGDDEVAAEEEDSPAPAASGPTADGEARAIQAGADQALDQARAMLGQSGLDPALVASMQDIREPGAFLDTLIGGLVIDAGQIEMVRNQVKANLKDLLANQGEDASLVDDLFLPEDRPEQSEDAADQASRMAVLKDSAPGNRHFGGEDLSNLDLSDMDLDGADFTGADLSGTRFGNARLHGADFSGASLDQADFRGAILTDATFGDADLTDAIMRSADLTDARLPRAIMTGLDATGADFTRADLSEANLEGSLMENTVLREVRADHADFSRATLTGADLRDAHLSGALFASTRMSGADLGGATGKAAIFSSADLTEANLSAGCFTDADFADARMDRSRWENTDLSRATFERGQGTAIRMTHANLTGVKAGEGTRFPEGHFVDVSASRSIWTDADLKGSDFSHALLERADFSRADMTMVRLEGARCRFANFDRSILRHAQVTRADLFMANLTRADMEASNLSDGSFYGAEFLDATFLKTNIQGADLKMTKLAGR